jgi:hypothetical protein
MVNSGDLIHQMIESRGREARVEVNPHKFRYTFSDRRAPPATIPDEEG